MNNALNILKNFIENRLSINDLEDAIYSNQDLISILEQAKTKPYMNSDTVYDYIISQDLSLIDSKLNLIEIFREILDANNVEYKHNTDTEEIFDLILDSVPDWVPSSVNYINYLYDKYQPKNSVSFKKIIKEHFIYINKAPKWLQDPEWPINKSPAVFIGQLDISKIQHDTSYLYIFWDKEENKYIEIVQTM
ncbi:Uncharacterised protein [Neisseria zoodegmatis]|uniref:Uncharacterized protein n=1 Tax=Neisseria zoodegmatis TaxID=326523 RepID=A0A378WGZ6_9NEIS|nr:hypothetical protein [Neisseria zoodegmatis]SUA35713.1 Uncharacterised protein [Neisseria zoodegmatis]